MAELIPDASVYRDEEPSKRYHHSRRPHKKGKVTDIVLWVECFAIFTGVLTSKYPQSAPDLMAYQRTIVHASRTYKGDCWLSYDTTYSRRAAACKSLHWAQIDFTLYNETFTGMARPIPRCTNCASEYHKSHECPVAAISTPTTESTFYAKPLSTLSEAGMGNNSRELCGCTTLVPAIVAIINHASISIYLRHMSWLWSPSIHLQIQWFIPQVVQDGFKDSSERLNIRYCLEQL